MKVIITKNKNYYNIIMGFSSGHSTKKLFLSLFPGRIENWKCWFLRREENRRTQSKTLEARTRNNNHLNLEVHGRFVPTVVSHPVVLHPNAVDLYPI